MTRLYLVKSEGGDLLGWGPNDNAFLHRLGAGECIECDTRKARNPQHHRKFMALMQRAVQGQNKYASLKPLLIELKLRCDWYDEHITREGVMVYVPRSISFANMDQAEFDKFYRRAVVELSQMFPENEDIGAEADEILMRELPHEQLSA